ncbi:MAG: hypothetical protein PHE15_03425 [Dehalococcoidales bacterium]|nr:hypothetical protein [Dehalococcoidales bacterium]
MDNLRKYPIYRSSFAGKVVLEKIELDLIAILNPISVQKFDGLKFILNDGWVLIRKSGTEPMIRLTVEAKTEERAQYVYEKVENFIMESIRE